MVELSFFPIDIDYVDKEIKAEIRLFGRTEKGERICVIDKNFRPYFWVISKDIDKIKDKIESIKNEDYEVTGTEIDTKIDKGKSIEALRVYVDRPRSVPKIRKIVEDSLNAKTMESDILFVRRYLIDKDIIISLAFFGENFKKVITWRKFKTQEKIFFVNSEAELIEEFVKTIKEYKPDYLVGYFSDGFDFPYIAARAKKYSILLDISLDS